MSEEIRVAGPRDEAALLALFARVFGRPMSLAHRRWKLTPRIPGLDPVIVGCEDDLPIFQYAGLGGEWETPRGRRRALVSVDTMADPERRRRGLLTRVGRFSYEHWASQGAAFVIGVPNERWGSRAAALGWAPLFTLACRMRPLLLDPPPLARWPIEELHEAPPALDGLWARVRTRYEIAAVKDAAWVRWRFLEAPLGYRLLVARRERIDGYAAFRVAGENAYLVELIADDPRAGAALIDRVAALARAAGARRLLALVPPTDRALFLARGFVFRRGDFVVQAVVLRADLLPARGLAAHRWLFTGADFDVH